MIVQVRVTIKAQYDDRFEIYLGVAEGTKQLCSHYAQQWNIGDKVAVGDDFVIVSEISYTRAAPQ